MICGACFSSGSLGVFQSFILLGWFISVLVDFCRLLDSCTFCVDRYFEVFFVLMVFLIECPQAGGLGDEALKGVKNAKFLSIQKFGGDENRSPGNFQFLESSQGGENVNLNALPVLSTCGRPHDSGLGGGEHLPVEFGGGISHCFCQKHGLFKSAMKVEVPTGEGLKWCHQICEIRIFLTVVGGPCVYRMAPNEGGVPP